jgi:hypothetical protein
LQTREYLRTVIDPLLSRYAGSSVKAQEITV